MSRSLRQSALKEEIDDEAILELVKSGDVDAFALIINRYQRYVMAILFRHVDHDAVEELCQDVFLQAYESIATYRGRAPFRFWLSAIAVRRCYAFWRERKRRDRHAPASSLSPEAIHWCEKASLDDAQLAFDTAQSAVEAREVVKLLLQGLSAEDRLIIGLVHLEERSITEVAELFGWSASNVKIRAYRARKIMQKKLRKMISREGR